MRFLYRLSPAGRRFGVKNVSRRSHNRENTVCLKILHAWDSARSTLVRSEYFAGGML